MKIAVAGGTGRIGRHIVDVLTVRGHEVVAMSRSSGVDVISGEGLANALVGVQTIVDAANGPPTPDQAAATEFFTTASRKLQEAGARAGVQSIFVVSIIGVDRFTAGYMAAKVAHENAMRSGPVPVRILRAAQFHELIPQFIEWGRKGDVSYVPTMRAQLVAARAAAEVAADMVTDPAVTAADGLPFAEVAGPRPEDVADAAARYVARRGGGVRIEGVVNAGDPDLAVYASGALLPAPEARLVGPTFDEWLGSTLAVAHAG